MRIGLARTELVNHLEVGKVAQVSCDLALLENLAGAERERQDREGEENRKGQKGMVFKCPAAHADSKHKLTLAAAVTYE